MSNTFNTSPILQFVSKLIGIKRIAKSISLNSDIVTALHSTGQELFTVDKNLTVSIEKGLIFSTIVISNNSQKCRAWGFSKSAAQGILNEANVITKKFQEEKEIDKLNSLVPEFKRVYSELEDSHIFRQYISKNHYTLAEKQVSPILDEIKKVNEGEYIVTIPEAISVATDAILPLLSNYSFSEKQIEKYNSNFIDNELKSFKNYFDNVESNPLTPQQSRACIVNEDANLVVAGAGTGKTSTIVGKCGYLIKKELLSPAQVLLLAYGKKASVEMNERISEKVGNLGIKASTFHSLGLSIIGVSEGSKPSLAEFASNEYKRGAFFKSIQDRVIDNNPKYRKKLLKFFAYHLVDSKSEFDFKSAKEYFDYIKSEKFITLQGEEVKSYSELIIANDLFLNGVLYIYEKNYKYETATPYKKNYQPDFYLPAQDLYLEFYGIDRNGKTASFVDNQKYLEGIEWKRNLHQVNNTICLELFYYQMKEGKLLDELQKLLKLHEVKKKPVDIESAVIELNKKNTFDSFSDLLSDFTKLFKQEGYSIDDLMRRSNGDKRHLIFLQVFQEIFNEYQSYMKKNNLLDFEDMIIRATHYVKEGKYMSPYKFILVDEFQDISRARANLVRALIDQKELSKVFCVGDDWQSIYRFSGSDISLMTGFQRHFGVHFQIELDKTFRYNSMILELSNKFVMLNQSLIKKSLKSHSTVNDKRVQIFYYSNKDPDNL